MSEQPATRRRYLGALGTAVTAGLAGCSDAFVGWSGIDEETRERYVGVATRIATELQEWQQARTETTRLLAQTGAVQTQEERQRWLTDAEDDLPADVFRVHLVEPSGGEVTASTSRAKVGSPLNTREAPWLAGSIEYGEEGVFVSRAVEALTRSLVSFVTPVGSDGDRTQLLVLQTSMDEVATTIAQPPGDVYTQIIDADGRIVAGTRDIQQLERNDGMLSAYPGGGDARAVQLALAGESGFLAEPAINDSGQGGGNADSYVVAYAGVEDREWAVLTHVPRRTAKNG